MHTDIGAPDAGCARKEDQRRSVVVQCVHGDEVSYPTASVEITVGDKSFPIDARVLETFPVSMLLERDVPKLVRLRNEGDKESIVEQTAAVEVLAVTTRFNRGHRWRNLPRSTSVSCPLVFSLKQWKKRRSMNARVKTSLPKERRSTEEPPVL